jgi:hypothetical protein
MTLVDRIERKRLAHKNRAADQQRLTDDVTRQIRKELDLVELIERTAHTIETSVDDLIAKRNVAPVYVGEQYEQLRRAYGRLSWLLVAIEPKKLEAAE